MINSTRLSLRQFKEQDFKALFEYLSNPIIYRFELGEPVSLEKARKLAYERSQNNVFWAVTLKRTKELIGHLYFKQKELNEFLTWELGYIFNPSFHNNGYATEASLTLIRYGFEHWGIHRGIANCNPENVASWRVMEKIGMKREGYLRKNVFFRRDNNGSPLWTDTYKYTILKEDAGLN
jgi:RimJ/RimL family protein N-acetyltransferase